MTSSGSAGSAATIRSRARGARSRLLAGFAVVALAGGLLAACTTTAGKPKALTSVSGSGSTAASGGSATGAETGSAAPTSGPSGSGTGPGTGGAPVTGSAPGTGSGSGEPAPSGTAGTAGTADTSPQIPPVTYQTDPAEAALEKALPGVYGLDSLGATVSGSKISIDAPASCAFVMEVLGAGQWSITDLVKPTKTSNTYTAVLVDGPDRALLSLSDTGTVCQGMIVTPVDATLTITGALTAGGAATLYPLTCPSGGGTDAIPMYAIYATEKATYLVAISVVPAVGKHTAKGSDDSGDAEMLLYQASSTPDPGPALKAMVQLSSPLSDDSESSGNSGGTDDSLPPGWDGTKAFGTVSATTMTVTVSSVDPLQGTVTATKVANPAKPSSTISLTATFSCGG